jgi:hypothetical protein
MDLAGRLSMRQMKEDWEKNDPNAVRRIVDSQGRTHKVMTLWWIVNVLFAFLWLFVCLCLSLLAHLFVPLLWSMHCMHAGRVLIYRASANASDFSHTRLHSVLSFHDPFGRAQLSLKDLEAKLGATQVHDHEDPDKLEAAAAEQVIVTSRHFMSFCIIDGLIVSHLSSSFECQQAHPDPQARKRAQRTHQLDQ